MANPISSSKYIGFKLLQYRALSLAIAPLQPINESTKGLLKSFVDNIKWTESVKDETFTLLKNSNNSAELFHLLNAEIDKLEMFKHTMSLQELESHCSMLVTFEMIDHTGSLSWKKLGEFKAQANREIYSLIEALITQECRDGSEVCANDESLSDAYSLILDKIVEPIVTLLRDNNSPLAKNAKILSKKDFEQVLNYLSKNQSPDFDHQIPTKRQRE